MIFPPFWLQFEGALKTYILTRGDILASQSLSRVRVLNASFVIPQLLCLPREMITTPIQTMCCYPTYWPDCLDGNEPVGTLCGPCACLPSAARYGPTGPCKHSFSFKTAAGMSEKGPGLLTSPFFSTGPDVANGAKGVQGRNRVGNALSSGPGGVSQHQTFASHGGV